MGSVRTASSCLAALVVTGACGGNASGSLELTLSLPSQADLRPTGMTTVTLTASAPGESPIGTTSVLNQGTLATADLPVGNDISLGVVLRDVSNRIVGVGEAGQAIDIVGDKAVQLSIPVRRPFVYAASGSALYSFDPTLDPRDAKFQGMLAGVSSPQFVVSVGGDRLAVLSGSAVQIVITETNAVMGSISVGSTVRDAAAVPGTHKLAVATDKGIAIVDLDASSVANAGVGPVDRVTVGPDSAGAMIAYGLVGQVLPPDKPSTLATCTGTSKIVAVSVDNPVTVTPAPVTAGVSDIAAAPDQPMLFATLPCTGKVVSVKGLEGSALQLQDVSDLERASVLTVAGDRIWAAGTKMSTAACSGAGGCTPATSITCPQSGTNHLAYVTDGAHLIVKSIPLDGSNAITLDVPGRRETMVDQGDAAMEHAQVLKALGVVPLDLVALPGGQYVALVTRSRYYVERLDDGVQVILPCLDATVADWELIDMASSSVAQRVRTQCNLTYEPGAFFATWGCDDPPAGETSKFPAPYQATSVGALFGSR